MKKILSCCAVLVCLLAAFSRSHAQNQAATDDKILRDYFAKKHIKAKKTASGLYYVISKKGTGPNAKANQNVSMYYSGKFLDGRVFDGNVDDQYHLQNGRTPLNFRLGVGQVIAGWDEGIQLLNPGSRATFYIPSALGYGASGNGPIPPNTCMMFNVELISVDK